MESYQPICFHVYVIADSANENTLPLNENAKRTDQTFTARGCKLERLKQLRYNSAVLFLVCNISFSQKAIFQPAVERLVKFSNLTNSLSMFHEVFAVGFKTRRIKVLYL